MKFNLIKVVLILCILAYSFGKDDINKNEEEYKKIYDYIIKNAQKIQDGLKKSIKPNKLSNKHYEKRDLKLSEKEKKAAMSYPTSIYRTCIYPFIKDNHAQWCEKHFFKFPEKLNACLHNMCQVCCDNLPVVYTEAAKTLPLGSLFNLQSEEGASKIKNALALGMIQKCKKECEEVFPLNIITK